VKTVIGIKFQLMTALKILEQNIGKIMEMVELVKFLLISITW